MNKQLFTEMTGKRARTAGENAAYYKAEDAAFRLRLASLPKDKAEAICRKFQAQELQGTSGARVASEWLAANT